LFSGKSKIRDAGRPAYVIIDLGGSRFGGSYENNYELDDLVRGKVRYVILNEVYYRPFLNPKRQKERVLAFTRELEKRAEAVQVFDPFQPGAEKFFLDHEAIVTPFDHIFRLRSSGPRLTIYKLTI
jgi:hypothetical protein